MRSTAQGGYFPRRFGFYGSHALPEVHYAHSGQAWMSTGITRQTWLSVLACQLFIASFPVINPYARSSIGNQ